MLWNFAAACCFEVSLCLVDCLAAPLLVKLSLRLFVWAGICLGLVCVLVAGMRGLSGAVPVSPWP